METRTGFNPSDDHLLYSIKTKIAEIFRHLDALGDPNHPLIGLDAEDSRSSAVNQFKGEINNQWIVFQRIIKRLHALGERQAQLRSDHYQLRYAPADILPRTCECGEQLTSEVYDRQYPYEPDVKVFVWCNRCGYWGELPQ